MPPTGFPDALTPIAQFVEWLQPSRVLDVGVGGGRMGFLAREYGHNPWHPRARGNGLVVDGIEGYEPYLGPVQRALYDELVVGEAIETLDRMVSDGVQYDLVIASDILEHFAPVDGRRFLDRCLAVAPLVLIATPRDYFDQESEGNELDTHRSFWPEAELVRAGATAILHRGATTVALFGDGTLVGEYLHRRRRPLHAWFLPPAAEDVLRAAVLRWRLR